MREIGDERGRDRLSMWDLLPSFHGSAADGARAVAIVAKHLLAVAAARHPRVAEADVGSDDDLEAKAIAGKMHGFRAERRIASTIADLLSAPKPAIASAATTRSCHRCSPSPRALVRVIGLDLFRRLARSRRWVCGSVQSCE
jgi:hypothetical protein